MSERKDHERQQFFDKLPPVQHAFAFGMLLNSPAVTERYGFIGREYDTEALKYRYRGRDDPATARFLCEDPLGLQKGGKSAVVRALNDIAKVLARGEKFR